MLAVQCQFKQGERGERGERGARFGSCGTDLAQRPSDLRLSDLELLLKVGGSSKYGTTIRVSCVLGVESTLFTPIRCLITLPHQKKKQRQQLGFLGWGNQAGD